MHSDSARVIGSYSYGCLVIGSYSYGCLVIGSYSYGCLVVFHSFYIGKTNAATLIKEHLF